MSRAGKLIARLLGSLLVVLALSNVGFALGSGRPIGPFIPPAVLVGLLGAGLWYWTLRSPTRAPRSESSEFWRIVAMILGSLLILYSLGVLGLFALVGRAYLALDTFLLFGGAGAILWAWAFISGRPGPALMAPLGAPVGPGGWAAAGPPLSAAPPASLLPSATLSRMYVELEQAGQDSYSTAAALVRWLTYELAVMAAAFAGLCVVVVALFGAQELVTLGVLPLMAAYFAFSAWSLRRRFDWIGRELNAGRIPSEAELNSRMVWGYRPRPQEGTSPSLPPPPQPLEAPAVLARTLAQLQFGQRMVKLARQSAVALFLFGLLLGSAAGWFAVFGLLMHFAGGSGEVVRNAAIAWLVAGGIALFDFWLLHGWYGRVDRVERRYRSFEETTREIERSFWVRF